MGLAASQARLLNLTARMHDIEYKAQNLEAQKLQMSNESTTVYQEYENALNRQKVQLKSIAPDGSATYDDACLKDLFDGHYRLKILDSDNNWQNVGSYTKDNKLGSVTTGITPLSNYTPDDALPGDRVIAGSFAYILTSGSSGNGSGHKITEIESLNMLNISDINVLNNLVEAGFIVFEKPEYENGVITGYVETNIATDTNLQEVQDPVELKKAEAKYEADMRKINAKDKKFDTDIAALEAERNAIKTEIDTLKSVAKENVDRTYKLFS